MLVSAETWIDRAINEHDKKVCRVKKPLKKRSIDRNDYKKLISKYHDRNKFRLMFELLWNTGMRPIEVCWLHRNNFNEDFSFLEYKIAKPKTEMIKEVITKVYKSREITIPNSLAKRILKYWEGINLISPYGYLFPSFQESRFRKHLFFMNPRIINKEMDSHRKVFGGRWLERNGDNSFLINPRSFRISWITRYGKKCKDIFKTAKAIGHSDPRTTACYFDPVNIEELRAFQNHQEVNVNVLEISTDQTLLNDFCSVGVV